MTAILGISAFYHDSAAALIIDGEVVAAAQEERFSRIKNDAQFPRHAVEYCLDVAGLQPDQLDHVGFYEKPFLKFERLLETCLAVAPGGLVSFLKSMPVWLKQKTRITRELNRGLSGKYRKRFVFAEHHQSHAASAFFPSPFEEAAILTLDGVGEWATGTMGVGKGNRIELTHEMRFPHSPGLLYSAFTYFTGFEVNSGEYKLMGLAPYGDREHGQPRYVDLILGKLIDLKADGSFRMDLSYFDFVHGLRMTSNKMEKLFGRPRRKPESPITQSDMDIAASIQQVIEMIMIRSARRLQELTGQRNLCLAGGVALNCVANSQILQNTDFERIWIQPAAGDAGGALGVAWLIWHQLLGRPRPDSVSDHSVPDRQQGSLLGPEFDHELIRKTLAASGLQFDQFECEARLCDYVAELLIQQKVIGWFQGRMEFGPRVLGSRSLLADPRGEKMQALINQKIKFRESFRPFAPAILEGVADTYFDLPKGQPSPYMLLVAPIRENQRVELNTEDQHRKGLDKLNVKRSLFPAITHVDYSSRVQTVNACSHPRLGRLLESFQNKTGCPMLVNTSFNVRDEPIVCTPQDAVSCFQATEMDVLVIGDFVVLKPGVADG